MNGFTGVIADIGAEIVGGKGQAIGKAVASAHPLRVAAHTLRVVGPGAVRRNVA